ncbi:hypothetical protein ACMAZH_11650 [Arenicellales bacterium nBUS_45]
MQISAEVLFNTVTPPAILPNLLAKACDLQYAFDPEDATKRFEQADPYRTIRYYF